VAGAGPWDSSPRQIQWGLSPRLLWGAVLAGELVTAVFLFATGNVAPVLIRSLQLFLRF
jgi:hypothetical protein